ncbi:MAG: GTP cyclohydrolase [Legionellales bacterium]|nr:GTP cyclohydrolase [Legionellales bacterium]|tara:strand:- start:147 stop:437 length:291 start_codon:yes stop_codon:yes gene_type:complete
MLIIELSYKKDLDEVNKHLNAHRDFLDVYYKKGIFFASGPKTPRTGGIILTLADRHSIENILKDDPFYQHQIADFHITEFTPTKYSQAFKEAMLFD